MLQARTWGRGPAGRLAPLLALAVLAAAPAEAGAAQSAISADGRSLTLTPGELVTARLEADGRLVHVLTAPAPAKAALPPKPGQGDLEPDAAKGGVSFLLGVEGGKSTLKIASGLDQALDYRATLRRGPSSADEPARACTVLPLLASWEQWPYAVSRLTLSGFQAKKTNEVACAGPAASQEMIP
jgi:hypothetical protein